MRRDVVISGVEVHDTSPGAVLGAVVLFLVGAICGGFISWGALLYMIQKAGGVS